jgi:dTDP-4-dehydrorhamnose 3,5-epimerase-like enzyme
MNKPQLLHLPKFLDDRGNLSFIEEGKQIPFIIERTYWIHDVPGGEVRGGHAFKKQKEFIVALSGSFDVVWHDGITENRVHLNRSYYGFFIPPMIWRHLENFSTNAVALVLSSTLYDQDDYIRDFNQFLNFVKA